MWSPLKYVKSASCLGQIFELNLLIPFTVSLKA
jgi:hypothetical protein